MENSPSVRLVYILAASHSGSTLLSMLLASHEQVATIGEMKLCSMGDVGTYRCSCGHLIEKCRFWQAVKEGMLAKGFEFDLAGAGTDYRSVDSWYARRLLRPLYRGRLLENIREALLALSPAWKENLERVQEKNAALASTLARISGAEVVVDSSKNALRLKYLLRNPRLDVKVIHLVRDGRAVALTYMDTASFADAQQARLRGGGSGNIQWHKRLPMEQAAYQWLRWMEEAEHALAQIDSSRWTEIHYEQLCLDTENTLKRILEFIGLDPQEKIMDFRSVEHHIVGNGMRLDTTSQVRLDERWPRYLTSCDLRAFKKIAGRINKTYGYE